MLSSKGHICDLATSGSEGLGIDIKNDFHPTYKISSDKEKLVETLKKECNGRQVYLATDPDREGEAIAYHLATTLGLDLDDNNRIEFNEITKNSVKEAINNPHKINLKMVDSQEARRMIDRILGFRLSKLMQRKINSLSAGRVQSVALSLIVNLEKERLSFIPENYYEIEAIYNNFKIKLVTLNNKKIDKNNKITDRKVLENLKTNLGNFVITNIEYKKISKASYPTYTTSTLQQDANVKLGFSSTKTMQIAQSLYEGKNVGDETVGLITYMRTDSTRLADQFVGEAKNFILKNYGPAYVGNVKIRNQKGQQDAHEGIRPTSINRTPDSIKDYLNNDEYRLYKLIYNRTLASLMSNSTYDSTRVDLKNTNSTWQMNGSKLSFDGYLKIYDRDEEDLDSLIPNFNTGDSFIADEVTIFDKVTEPKSRYTEASLIKDMEELGIGRPSTYAQTIYTLKERKYVTLEKKSLVPTEQGILTCDKLVEYFGDIINVKYTANMELDLDKIAKGEKGKLDELKEFYSSVDPIYEYAKSNMDSKYPIYTDMKCPNCNSNLIIQKGRYGEFTCCSNYPNCNYIKKDDEPEDTGILCPVCKKKNIVKRISKTGINKGQIFYACSNYPKCKTTYNDLPTNELCPNCNSMMLKDNNGNLYCSAHCETQKEEFICPICGVGHIVEKVALRGKNKGNKFYACSNYPRCKTILAGQPTNDICSNCL